MKPLLALLLLSSFLGCSRTDEEDIQRHEDVDERDFYESDSYKKTPFKGSVDDSIEGGATD